MKLEKTGSTSAILVESPDNLASAMRLVRTLGKGVVVVLPGRSAAFRHPADFRELQRMKRVLQVPITLVITGSDSRIAWAHRYGLPVYPSLAALFGTTARQRPHHSGGRASWRAPLPTALSPPHLLPPAPALQAWPGGSPPGVSSAPRGARRGSSPTYLDALLALLVLGFL